MTKLNAKALPSLVERFFMHLISELRMSPCTIASYRDTFRLLLNHIQTQTHRRPSDQRLEDWDAPGIPGFLEHLEKQRRCCARSRNVRLAAIHCFMRYLSHHQPACLALAQRVLAIPSKKHAKPLLGYLTPPQIQAILEAPNPATFSGRRDRILFQLLYNTGARVSEVVALNREDLLPPHCRTITLHGKGRKERRLPLWKNTARMLRQWVDRLPPEPSAPLFTNRLGNRISRFGIEKRLALAARIATEVCPSLRGRQVSPHLLRHTTAMHLLQAGVDITAIALWLGHQSPLTTHQYIEADLEMKKITLSRIHPPSGRSPTFQPGDALLTFLEAL